MGGVGLETTSPTPPKFYGINMYIALDPRKANQFTTAGIRLIPSRPVAQVPNNIDDDVMERILEAIRQGIIYQIPDDEAAGITIPGIGSVDAIQEDENTIKYEVISQNTEEPEQVITDFFGQKIRLKKRMIIFRIPEEESKVDQPSIVLTDRR